MTFSFLVITLSLLGLVEWLGEEDEGEEVEAEDVTGEGAG